MVLEGRGWSAPADNPSLVEAYRAFLGSLRSNRAHYDGTGAFTFVSNREELRVNRGLHSLFCLVSLYSSRGVQTFPDVTVPLEGSTLTPHVIRTMARVVQSFLEVDPDVTNHFADVSFVDGLSQSFRSVRPSFSQVRFSPWTAIHRSSRSLIQTRLRESFDRMVSRQDQTPTLRLVTSQPGFSVPDHVVRSPVGPRRVSQSSLTLAVVSDPSEPASSSLPPHDAPQLDGSSSVADAGQSASVASESVVSEPVRPHVHRLPAAPLSTDTSSLFSRVARKTVRGGSRQSRRLIYRSLDRDETPR